MKKTLLASFVVLSLLAFPLSVLAWEEPGNFPPDGNVGAPIHIGAQAQTKAGALTILGDTSAATKGLMVGGDGNNGSNALILQNATQNLIYGNVDAASQGNLLNLQVEGATKFIINKDGNVGIGVTAPTQKLDVAGSVVIPMTINTTSGVVYKGATPFIHNFTLTGTNGNNTFVGLNAGNFSMTGSAGGQGSNNTTIGQNTLRANTTGYQNTAIGMEALSTNTSGNQNTALGMRTLWLNTTGYQNVANGTLALRSNTTGYQNTANGAYSLYNNTTGYQNTANGYNALWDNTTGSYNTANGLQALWSNTTGNYNTANGLAALRFNTSGNNNTADGVYAGYSITIGNNNTFLGYSAGFNASQKTNAINSMALGNGTYTTADNQVVIGNTSVTQTLLNGNVGIGTTAPTQKLDVAGDVNITGSYRVNGTPIATGGQWSTSGNNIYNANIGNVGIGTGVAVPTEKLDVRGNIFLQGNDGFNLAGETATLTLGDSKHFIKARYWGGPLPGGIEIGSSNDIANPIRFTFEGNEIMRVTNNGVGVGMTNPGLVKLNVGGTTGTALKISDGGDIVISPQISGNDSMLYNDTGTLSITTGVNASGNLYATGNILADGVLAGAYSSGSGDAVVVGNDLKLVDINIANTMGIYGQQDSTVGAIKFGSSGGTLTGGDNGYGASVSTNIFEVSKLINPYEGAGPGGSSDIRIPSGKVTTPVGQGNMAWFKGANFGAGGPGAPAIWWCNQNNRGRLAFYQSNAGPGDRLCYCRRDSGGEHYWMCF